MCHSYLCLLLKSNHKCSSETADVGVSATGNGGGSVFKALGYQGKGHEFKSQPHHAVFLDSSASELILCIGSMLKHLILSEQAESFQELE